MFIEGDAGAIEGGELVGQREKTIEKVQHAPFLRPSRDADALIFSKRQLAWPGKRSRLALRGPARSPFPTEMTTC
jgi:hypothetical protein